MRLSAELFGLAEQRPNALGERELVLRGVAIPAIEHLAVTRDAFDAIDFSDNRLVRLENFPRLLRLSSLVCPGNLIESLDAANMKKNIPNVTSLTLSYNRISSLHEVANIGRACPKLEFLSLTGNPVTKRQHYRLYALQHIPSLKTLDFVKIKSGERDRAERLANSAAGAALESDVQVEARRAADTAAASAAKTFVPGEGESAEQSFVTNFSPEQKETIRRMVANAKSPAEIDEIERSVARGVFPSLPTVTPPPPAGPPAAPAASDTETASHAAESDGVAGDQNLKRPAEEPATNGTEAKKGRLKD